jgi:hypothetical protein
VLCCFWRRSMMCDVWAPDAGSQDCDLKVCALYSMSVALRVGLGCLNKMRCLDHVHQFKTLFLGKGLFRREHHALVLPVTNKLAVNSKQTRSSATRSNPCTRSNVSQSSNEHHVKYTLDQQHFHTRTVTLLVIGTFSILQGV